MLSGVLDGPTPGAVRVGNEAQAVEACVQPGVAQQRRIKATSSTQDFFCTHGCEQELVRYWPTEVTQRVSARVLSYMEWQVQWIVGGGAV